MALQIPTVTVHDLREFHAKHFLQAQTPEHFLYGVKQEAEYYEDEDDGLGYYEDGFKRTLTDEQIAIFRHSEIQSIIRERRRVREASRSPSPEPFSMEVIKSPTQAPTLVETQPKGAVSPSPSVSLEISGNTDEVQISRMEKPQQQWTKTSAKTKARNAKNRTKNRKNYRARKKEERRQRERQYEDDESDEWDPWHQANGPDVQKDTTIDLDY